MVHLLAALICGLISLLCFSLAIEQVCKLSPRFKKWWRSNSARHREHRDAWKGYPCAPKRHLNPTAPRSRKSVEFPGSRTSGGI